MRGEERLRADLPNQVLGDRPGDGDAVEGRGAAADLSRITKPRSVALFMMLAVSFISTMKVERPKARSSELHARRRCVDHPDVCAVGRDDTHLRHQGDQGHLAGA